jgi:hypothetical protein
MWRTTAFALALSFPVLAPAQESIVDTPVLDPANPVAGQPVSVLVHGGICVLYLNDPSPSAASTVTRQGNAVKLTVQAIVAPSGFCVYPAGTAPPYPIGSFEPGTYTVEVDAQYETFLGGTVTQVLGVIPFSVSASASVPILSSWTLVLLVLGLGCATYAGAPNNSLKRTAGVGLRYPQRSRPAAA